MTDNVPAQTELRNELKQRELQFGEFLKASGIAPERFMQSLYSALRNSPNLMRCTRSSLVNAALKAAEDQLMPDGIEGAIVPYREGEGGESTARWLPMIQGIAKKVMQHPEIKSWEFGVVQEGDTFDYSVGTSPFLHYKKAETGGRTRPIKFAFSVAHFVNGGTSIEVMNADEIEDVRKKSKAKHGPWQDPIFYPQMAVKTVAKLHAKRLPKTGALELVLQRDEDMYDMAPPQAAPSHRSLPGSAKATLDHFAPAGGDHSPGPGEDHAEAPRESAPDSTSRGDKLPKSVIEYKQSFDIAIENAIDPDALHDWFYSNAQRDERVRLGMTIKQYEALRGAVGARIKELGGRKNAGTVA
jgi:recombination protein RecT